MRRRSITEKISVGWKSAFHKLAQPLRSCDEFTLSALIASRAHNSFRSVCPALRSFKHCSGGGSKRRSQTTRVSGGGRYLIDSALLPRMRPTVGSVPRSRRANYRIRVVSCEQLSTWRNTDNTLQRAYYVLTGSNLVQLKNI